MSNSSAAIPAQNAPVPAQALDQDERDQLALIDTLVVTVRHFFGGFAPLFHPIHDPRVPYLITYALASMCFAGVLMFLCRLGARRQINNMFRGNGPSEAQFRALFDVETCPHGDTLNVLYSRLEPSEVQEVLCGMVETFPERHCPHCLTRIQNGKTTYYHPVLEAKWVTPDGFAFSI